jgi:hypothetical protein
VVDVRPSDAAGPDERAMDDFFSDPEEMGEDRRSGRLRRRR